MAPPYRFERQFLVLETNVLPLDDRDIIELAKLYFITYVTCKIFNDFIRSFALTRGVTVEKVTLSNIPSHQKQNPYSRIRQRPLILFKSPQPRA